jgi:hypothetical protein|tara:strand:- start:548 stop:916 length:369 start_codon:yes stop_codon:yes gene_type:complete
MEVISYERLQGKEFKGRVRNYLDFEICLLMFDCFKDSEYHSFEGWVQNFNLYLNKENISKKWTDALDYIMEDLGVVFGFSVYESLFYIIQFLKKESWSKYIEIVKEHNRLFITKKNTKKKKK